MSLRFESGPVAYRMSEAAAKDLDAALRSLGRRLMHAQIEYGEGGDIDGRPFCGCYQCVSREVAIVTAAVILTAQASGEAEMLTPVPDGGKP